MRSVTLDLMRMSHLAALWYGASVMRHEPDSNRFAWRTWLMIYLSPSQMGPLWECMQKNVDYYAPQLSALEAGKRPAGSSSGEGTADPPTGESGGSAFPAAAAAAGAEAVDFDNLTDKDIEAYLERIDREEGGGTK